jgi:hypothetical protein
MDGVVDMPAVAEQLAAGSPGIGLPVPANDAALRDACARQCIENLQVVGGGTPAVQECTAQCVRDATQAQQLGLGPLPAILS